MNEFEHVIKIINKNKGIITSSEAKSCGINNKTLQRMTTSGDLIRLEKGLYMDPNQMEDAFFITQYRCKKGIFSHETALYFHELTDRTPMELMLTIPSGYNTRLINDKENYKFFYVNDKLHSIGKITLMTPFGHEVQVYDKERTLCDCLKKKEQLDGDVVNNAIKQYMKMPGADFAKLLRYAEIFNLTSLVRSYLEVLI